MATLKGVELQKWYGNREVVCGVSPIIHQKEIVGLLGPNGAGKTTSFYMLTGIIKPSSGKIFFENQDISSWPLYQRARVGISYLPQESSVFRHLTVRQNLQIILEYTTYSKRKQKQKADALLEDFGLTYLENSYAVHLSGGERRRLEIARALIQQPKFILLDEPFAGIDPLAIHDIQNIIQLLREKNIGILISDHNVRETLNICDRAYLMVKGQVILTGTPDDIINSKKARSMYLGESFCL